MVHCAQLQTALLTRMARQQPQSQQLCPVPQAAQDAALRYLVDQEHRSSQCLNRRRPILLRYAARRARQQLLDLRVLSLLAADPCVDVASQCEAQVRLPLPPGQANGSELTFVCRLLSNLQSTLRLPITTRLLRSYRLVFIA